MTTLLLLAALAPAAELHVSASVPTEVWLDGQPAAELYRPGSLTITLPEAGDTVDLRVFVEGKPQELSLPHPGATGTAFVVVGKQGVSTPGATEPKPVASGPVTLTVEVNGHEPLRVQLGDQRQRLAPGARLELGLEPGEHKLVVSSGDGHVRWASGTLQLTGTESQVPLVLQLADGKLPEVHGDGGVYWPDQG